MFLSIILWIAKQTFNRSYTTVFYQEVDDKLGLKKKSLICCENKKIQINIS